MGARNDHEQREEGEGETAHDSQITTRLRDREARERTLIDSSWRSHRVRGSSCHAIHQDNPSRALHGVGSQQLQLRSLAPPAQAPAPQQPPRAPQLQHVGASRRLAPRAARAPSGPLVRPAPRTSSLSAHSLDPPSAIAQERLRSPSARPFTLGNMVLHYPNDAAVLVAGLPGAGKSTLGCSPVATRRACSAWSSARQASAMPGVTPTSTRRGSGAASASPSVARRSSRPMARRERTP